MNLSRRAAVRRGGRGKGKKRKRGRKRRKKRRKRRREEKGEEETEKRLQNVKKVSLVWEGDPDCWILLSKFCRIVTVVPDQVDASMYPSNRFLKRGPKWRSSTLLQLREETTQPPDVWSLWALLIILHCNLFGLLQAGGRAQYVSFLVLAYTSPNFGKAVSHGTGCKSILIACVY